MTEHLVNHLKKTHECSGGDFRWKNIRKLVKKEVKGRIVLDAGCGTGHLACELLQEGYSVTATDYSQELVNFTQEKIRELNLHAKVYRVDLLNPTALPESYFDTIVCLDVLEHIEDDTTVLHNLKHMLKPGGVLILSVPACSWLYSLRDKEYGHYRRYNKPDLIRKLVDAELMVNSIRFWNIIGFFPYLILEKMLNQRIDKNLRNQPESNIALEVNDLLNIWFEKFENNFSGPFGLSLIAVCSKA